MSEFPPMLEKLLAQRRDRKIELRKLCRPIDTRHFCAVGQQITPFNEPRRCKTVKEKSACNALWFERKDFTRAFAIKLGSDPTAWQIYDGRLFIFGDVLGQTAWQVDPKWNVDHADRLWPEIKDKGWRGASLAAYASKVPHYKTGAQIRAEWELKNPGKTWPTYDVGGMMSNLFTKAPGWRAAEGHSQPALGYPD